MFESGGNFNPAYQSEEPPPQYKLGGNCQLKYDGDSVTSGVQISALVLHQISAKVDHTCVSNMVSPTQDNTAATEIRLYRKRFWILGLFSVCSMLNAMQWVQYTVVSDVTMCFYGVEIYEVNWTANLYLILYAPLVFPISWFTEKVGIRNSLLVGSFLTCVGTAIQCVAATPDNFNLVLVSQGIASVAQIFIISLPPYISATWFGAGELSRASAVGVFGNQLGCALGFIFTPLVMYTDCTNKDLIAHGRQIVAYTLLSCNLLVLVLILATFNHKPKLPPSLAQSKKTDNVKDYKRSICALLKNVHYVLLMITYGIIVGVSIAVGTIIYSLVSIHFPGRNTEIGFMGLIAILSGTVGSVVAGYILDKTHRYKETSVAIFLLSFASMVLFSGMLYVNLMWLQFITITILGFFLTSYLPVGFEFAVEITYPEPEAVSATLIIATTTVVGLVFAEIGSYLVENFNDVAANSFFCASILLGTIITAVIKCDFRRQQQRNEAAS